MTTAKTILLILGGIYHDFDGFAESMERTLGVVGHRVKATYDREILTKLEDASFDLVMVDTCLRGKTEQGEPGPDYTDAQVESLDRWVAEGGSLLGIHAATVSGQTHAQLDALLGGTFIEHPPQFTFTVTPLFHEHPIIADVPAFTVHDEFYIQRTHSDLNIHMVAIDRGKAHPMVWTRTHGKGQVAYIGMGHDDQVWDLAPYQRLIRQTIDWL
jgi:type 1 glutamine amidotransferase